MKGLGISDIYINIYDNIISSEMVVVEFCFSTWGTDRISTVKSRKFEIIGTRDLISNVESSNYSRYM